jgi:Ca2+-binding RTX toxin-like protein
MHKSLLQFIAAAAITSASLSAHAQRWVTISGRSPGTSYIGIVNDFGTRRLGMVTVKSDGKCEQNTTAPLNHRPGGGMRANTEFIGSPDGPNVMIVSNRLQTLCTDAIVPSIVEPLAQNGFLARVTGGPHNDWLFNGIFNNVILSGGSGDDTLVAPNSNVFMGMLGDDGNDFLFGNEDTVGYGGTGDDTFCAQPGHLFGSANGDAGWDRLCGAGTIVGSGLETTGCSCTLF